MKNIKTQFFLVNLYIDYLIVVNHYSNKLCETKLILFYCFTIKVLNTTTKR